MSFSALDRNHLLKKLETKDYDLLIIGGGITGAGIALDAALRGVKTALIEMNDFASGTSSRSTKLIHGGLRYLQQAEFKEVAELGRERAIVYENGPHVTTPIRMLLPFHQGGTFGKWTTAAGLRMYDMLARVKKEERKQMLTREEILQKEPLLKKGGLLGGGEYVEYRTDDARLTVEVMKTAADKGADIINYVKADSFIYKEGNKIAGVKAKDILEEKTIGIKSKVVVNASGPWVDIVRAADPSSGKGGKKRLKLSKGVHVVIDQSDFPLKHAVYFDAPDGRLIFAIPRNGKAYVGTTDTFYDGNPANVKPLKEDLEYLLACIASFFPDIVLSKKKIESSWAGVRPLIYEKGKSASEISRKDEIWESESGLITVAGGKLTGYRKMAERVVSLAVKKLESMGEGPFGPCITKNCVLSGGEIGGSHELSRFIDRQVKQATALGLTEAEGSYLAATYGSNIDKLFTILKEAGPSVDRVLYAQLMYSIYHEMTVFPEDFFIRRTGELYFNIQRVRSCKAEVLDLMSSTLNWSTDETEKYGIRLEQYLSEASGFGIC